MYIEVGFMIYGPNTFFFNYTNLPPPTHTHTHTHTLSLTMNSTTFPLHSKFIGSRQIFGLYSLHVHSEIQHRDCIEVLITFHIMCAVNRV
jgi:hypothetical protein